MPDEFIRINGAGVAYWQPNPDDDAAHLALLNVLTTVVNGTFPNLPGLTNTQVGNMGEFIALFVGTHCHGCHPCQWCFPVNALAPLNPTSHDGVDCVWFHAAATPADDQLVLQEVKTATTTDLGNANRLLHDFDRFFGTDPNTTLMTRLNQLKAKLEWEHHRDDLAQRITRFMQFPVEKLQNTRAIPTLVFDHTLAGRDEAEGRLVFVRDSLVARGWRASDLDSWIIGLGELNQRLLRLANGQN